MDLAGTLPCTQSGCPRTDATACDYVDRRSRHCRTAWCPAHRMTVEDRAYCRRHAGVISSLPTADSSLVTPLPDLDNRAPSLVGWVARQIDPDVWRILLRELDNEAGGQLIADPVTLVFVGIERQRAWERAWKLDTHMGISLRVSVLVEEANDQQVVVKVGANVVDRLVPPWITQREARVQVTPEADQQQREALNQRILDAIERGLAREREVKEYVAQGRTRDHPLHTQGESGVSKP